MKHAREVQFLLQQGKSQEFGRLIRTEVLPLLKKQPGFRDEVALVNNERAVAISLWDDRSSAEQYASKGYADVLKALTPVITGMPKVESYDIAATTLAAT